MYRVWRGGMVWFLSVLFPVMAWCNVTLGSQIDFDERGFVQIDGRPRLILGLYEMPEDDVKLKEIAESGFNLVRAPQDTAALDKIWEHGLYTWICLGRTVQLGAADADDRRRLSKLVNRYKDHPSLLVWELPDEALWNIWWSKYYWVFGGQQRELQRHIKAAQGNTPDETVAKWRSLLARADDYTHRSLWKQGEAIYDLLWSQLNTENPHPDWKMSQCPAQSIRLIEATERGCDLLRRLDPGHPIWQNHAPRNALGSLQRYNHMVDAAGCDIYPVPFNNGVGHSDLKDINLTAVGAYTDRMKAAAPGKSNWMVLQGFGWRDLQEEAQRDPDPDKGRRPNLRETRFMAYDAIVHGANAILYWGTASIEKDSALWRDLMTIVTELRALEPAIVGRAARSEPMARADETYGSIDGRGPRLMLRKAGDDWVLIAVNECAQGISFDVTGLPEELEGKTFYRLYWPETQIVEAGGFHDGIRGLDVHIYATSRRFESED